jgi:hypothetical protein
MHTGVMLTNTYQCETFPTIYNADVFRTTLILIHQQLREMERVRVSVRNSHYTTSGNVMWSLEVPYC